MIAAAHASPTTSAATAIVPSAKGWRALALDLALVACCKPLTGFTLREQANDSGAKAQMGSDRKSAR